MKILLDTHIILFSNTNQLSEKRLALLENSKNELFISQISLWEIIKLYELKRITPQRSIEHFLMSIYHHPKYNILDLNPQILLKALDIAPKMHKDPSDQIIVASAISNNTVLMTNDKLIKKSKLVDTI